jgi:hypothetical protein
VTTCPRISRPRRRSTNRPAAGCFEAIVHDLRAVLRFAEGRDPEPTAAIFDSRTKVIPECAVRNALTGGMS